MQKLVWALICAALVVSVASAETIAVGGTATTNIKAALGRLGEKFVDVGTRIPQPADGTILICSMDGGTEALPDYNTFMNDGGDVIVVGGSSLDSWRNGVRQYFTINTYSWKTDGDYFKTKNHPATQYMPDQYTFEEIGHTYHMLDFPDQQGVTLLGKNAMNENIHAFKDYSKNGSINYMALDLGIRAKDDQYIDNFVKSALYGARIPEPATVGLVALCLLVSRRR